MSRIDEIKARRAAISPAPWQTGSPRFRCKLEHSHDRSICVYVFDGWDGSSDIYVQKEYSYSSEDGLVAGMWDYDAGGIRKAEDAAFIAAAPDDIDFLLARIEELEG